LCVERKKRWWPSLGGVFADQASANILVGINTDIESLEERSSKWVHRVNKTFGLFLDRSLRSYLDTTGLFDAGKVEGDVYEDRQATFDAQLRAAFRAAEPLVKVDTSLYNLVHASVGGSLVNDRVLSQIPFSGHVMETSVKGFLSAEGLNDALVNGLFTVDNTVKHIDITTAMGAPYSPIVIDSLMRPISAQWKQAVAQGQRQKFWDCRRARPISEFTPAPQALIYCMVRGWFVGSLLGRIDRAGDPVRIARAGTFPTDFPTPFLSPSFGTRDQLPLVLEALGLAFVDANAEQTLEPLAAYKELRDLGSSKPGNSEQSLVQYPFLHPALKDWIETGNLDDDLKIGAALIEGNTFDTMLEEQAELRHVPAGRRNALVKYLRHTQKDYEEDLAELKVQWASNHNDLSGPPYWPGIQRIVNTQLDVIILATRPQKGPSTDDEV
jgi:hypothetical protein